MVPDLIGGFTLKEIAIVVGGIIALFIFLKILKSLFSRQEPDEHSQMSQCSCGWQGKVSRYAGRCPQCNNPLGEQKSRR